MALGGARVWFTQRWRSYVGNSVVLLKHTQLKTTADRGTINGRDGRQRPATRSQPNQSDVIFLAEQTVASFHQGPNPFISLRSAIRFAWGNGNVRSGMARSVAYPAVPARMDGTQYIFIIMCHFLAMLLRNWKRYAVLDFLCAEIVFMVIYVWVTMVLNISASICAATGPDLVRRSILFLWTA